MLKSTPVKTEALNQFLYSCKSAKVKAKKGKSSSLKDVSTIDFYAKVTEPCAILKMIIKYY